MEVVFAIISGAASIFTAVLAASSEIMFLSVIWLIVSFIVGCISIAKFHESKEEYGGSIAFVLAQIIVIGFFIASVFMIFNIAGF